MDGEDIFRDELTILCEQFLVYIKRLYNQGLINSDQYQEMSKFKIKYLEDVKKKDYMK